MLSNTFNILAGLILIMITKDAKKSARGHCLYLSKSVLIADFSV